MNLLETWRSKARDRATQLQPGILESFPRAHAPALSFALPPILPECADSYLVFVDGFFAPDLCRIPKTIVCLPLDVAMQTYALFLQNRWAKVERDPFCALNAALHGRGALIYVPAETACETPLQILHVVTDKHLGSSRLQIALGKQASLSIVQTVVVANGGVANNAIDLSLDAGAECKFVETQFLPKDAKSFSSLAATLKRDARLEAFCATGGAQSIRFSASIELAEENSSASLRSLAMLRESKEADFCAFVDHAAPHTMSRQHVKTVLFGKSKSNFEGKIFVRPGAHKTEAYQLNNNLLLSPEATAHAKPNLEIFESDVKASHGATFKELSQEELFYLQSRGLARSDANALLTQGFCRELIDAVEIDSLRHMLLQAMHEE